MRIFGQRKVVFLTAVLLVTAAVSALLFTQTGLRILVRSCERLAGPAFSVKQVEGTFVHGWRLDGVVLQVNSFADISIKTLRCKWSITGIRHPVFHLNRVRVQGVLIHLRTTQADDAARGMPVLPKINFPLEFRLDDVQILQADIFFPDKKIPLVVDKCVLQAIGRGDRLSIGSLVVHTPKYGATLKGVVSFHDNWPLKIDGHWKTRSLHSDNWLGSFTAQGDLESLQVSIETTEPIIAHARGNLRGILHDLRWTVTGKTGSFKGNNLGMHLPLSGTITALTASGTQTSYSGELTADIQYPGSPDMQTRLHVHGHLSGLTVDSMQVLFPVGSLAVTGRIDWKKGIIWQAKLRGDHLDPALFLPQWPGNIQTALSTRGHWNGTELNAEAAIERLQGSLRGRPLTGSGTVRLHKDVLLVNALHLTSGTTSCRIDGKLGPQLDCTVQIDSENLADIVPEGHGVLHGQAILKGERTQPRIEATIRGADVNIQGYSLQQIQASVNMDLAARGTVDLSVQAKDGMIGREVLHNMLLKVSGTREQQQIHFVLAGSPGNIEVTANGKISEKIWQGNVTKLHLNIPKAGNWSLERGKPGIVIVGKKYCEIAQWSLTRSQARLDLAGKWQRSSGWQVQAELHDLALNSLHPWNPLFEQLDGMLQASMQARGTAGHIRQGNVDVAIPTMSIRTKDTGQEREKTWQLVHTSLQADLVNGTAAIRAQSEVQGIGKAEVALRVQHCEPSARPETMPLAGSMDVHLSTLDFLAPLTGNLLDASAGHLAGHYSVAGTLARPVLQGDMSLSDGAVEVPDAGILLHDIQIGIVGTGTENKMDMRLVSGPGHLRVQGVLDHGTDQGWHGQWRIKGQDVQALHLAEYSVWASPDLHCVYGKAGLRLDGAITIPRAHIAPVRFKGAVSPSRDVRIVDAKGTEKKNSLPVSTDIRVTMGNEVELDAFGIKGFLSGSIQIIRKPGEDAIAIGSLELRDATFNLRGSILTITNGLVFYQGGPLTDPNIDLRAEKNVQGKVVGVRLTGRASRMKVDLFSDPAMDESDILAYLLVGHNFSQSDSVERTLLTTAVSAMSMGIQNSVLDTLEKKTGLDVQLEKGNETAGYSLVISKKIYKNLFLSYGKGLTDSESVFKIDYQLPDGFSVETESTSTANKVELFWSVEH